MRHASAVVVETRTNSTTMGIDNFTLATVTAPPDSQACYSECLASCLDDGLLYSACVPACQAECN